MDSIFSSLPVEIVLDLLGLLDKSSVTQLASVNKSHKRQFERDNGLWKQITCRLFGWNATDIKSVTSQGSVDWKKEYRVTSYYADKIKKNELKSDPRQVQHNRLSILGKNHFKFTLSAKELEEFSLFYFDLQSIVPLYPVPVGNFSVAYYEVELVTEGVFNGIVTVGGALDGFVDGIPGVGRNSFGYCLDGRIALECDYALKLAPECSAGDIMGFGIDFNKRSVFFTKNGKLVGEATKNYSDYPLSNLKALHATIGLSDTREIKANFGAKPFEFDLIKYQLAQSNENEEKGSRVNRLYSDALRDHLVAYSDQECSEIMIDGKNIFAVCDYNLPPPSIQVNPFLYAHIYRRSPPNFTGTMPEGHFEILSLASGLLNAYPLLPQLEHDEFSLPMIQFTCDQLGVSFENRPWIDVSTEALTAAMNAIGQVVHSLATQFMDDIIADLFDNWARLVLCFLIMTDATVEHTHFSVQLATKSYYLSLFKEPKELNQPFTYQQFIQIVSHLGEAILRIRATGIMRICSQKNKLFIMPQKIKDRQEAMRVYGADRQLDELFAATLANMDTQSGFTHVHPDAHPLMILTKLHLDRPTNAMFYAKFKLGMSPADYETECAYFGAVKARLEASITVQSKRACLEAMLAAFESDEVSVVHIVVTLSLFYGYTHIPTTDDEVKARARAFMKAKLVNLKRAEAIVAPPDAKSTGERTGLTGALLIGAGVVLFGAAIGALFYRKRHSK